jgi:hypothetical protein
MPGPEPESYPGLSSADAGRLSRLWPRPGGGDDGAGEGSSALGGAGVVPESDLPPESWGEQDLAAVLRHQLAAPLREAGAKPRGEIVTLGDLLTHPAPPEDLLRRVKKWAKAGMPEDAEAGGFPLPREVAGVLYFAAVAAALVRGGQPIARLEGPGVIKGARWALARRWLDEATASLFREALAGLEPRPAGPVDPVP